MPLPILVLLILLGFFLFFVSLDESMGMCLLSGSITVFLLIWLCVYFATDTVDKRSEIFDVYTGHGSYGPFQYTMNKDKKIINLTSVFGSMITYSQVQRITKSQWCVGIWAPDEAVRWEVIGSSRVTKLPAWGDI